MLTEDIEKIAKECVEKYLTNHIETAVLRSPERVHVGTYMTGDGSYQVYITAERDGERTKKPS